jgi:hypothetical protein
MKIYLESKEEKLYEITIDEFIRKTKKFANGQLNKSEAIKQLLKNFETIKDTLKDNDIHTIVLESLPSEGSSDYKEDYSAISLLQEFIIFYSEKLNDVLCNKVLNTKYIRSTGNPGYCDITLLGIKKSNEKLIIKSFIFATIPSEEELYVATTCGSGGTSILFEKLKELITDKNFYEPQNNKLKYIHLDSIEKAATINFYSKIEFYKKNKNTKAILQDMVKNIYNKDLLYEEYIRNSKLDIGGSMYWSDDSRVLKKLKCSYMYSPELWYKNIMKMKKDKIPKNQVMNHFYSRYQELVGAGIPDFNSKDGYALHAVIIHKPIELEDAMKEAKNFIEGNKNFYRETTNSYRFRNIAKQKFDKKTFRSKKVNNQLTLIYGKLL